MKRLIILYMILHGMIFLFSNGVYAQGGCGTEITEAQIQYIAEKLEQYQSQPKAIPDGLAQVKYIGILPHIVREDDETGGIDLNQVQESVNHANVHFATSGVQFYLLEEDYINSSKLYYFDDNSDSDTELMDESFTSDVINAYFIASLTLAGGSYCGYAYFPGSEDISDVTLMVNGCMGGDNGTFTHELGHMFHLYHTHGKSNNELTDELVDGSNCNTAGDEVCDTPAEPRLSGLVSSDCEYTGTAVDANGAAFDPIVNNIMSYGRTSCDKTFTTGQHARVTSANQVLRDYLEGYTESSFASFIADEYVIYYENSVQFTDQSLDAASWSWTFEGGSPANSSAQSPSVIYNSPGNFDVSLTITDSNGDNKTFTYENYITVKGPVDITYHTPDGWGSPVRFYLLGDDGETKIYPEEFKIGDNIYMEYGVANLGDLAANDSSFRVHTFVNNEQKWWNSFTLPANYLYEYAGVRLGLLPDGENEIRLEYDAEDDYPEFDEDNNTYTTTLIVTAPEITPTRPASSLTSIEYFFDTDPGFGEGTRMAFSGSNTDETLDAAFPFVGVSTGFHHLGIRAQNADGRWGQTHLVGFYKLRTVDRSLAGIEYFFDNDPGFGSGTFIATADNPMEDTLDVSIPVDGLSMGLHHVFTRAKTHSEQWGQTHKTSFYVVPVHDPSIKRSEYFFDNDPGYGNGVPITLSNGETSHIIELMGVSNGYHRLYVRVQNIMGQWSVTHAVSFMKVGKKVDPKLSRLEYAFFDYETSTYSDYISYPIDPVAEELDEVLLLDPAGLVEGKQYAVVVYAYDENGTRSRRAYDNFLYNEIVLINVDEIEITNVLCNGGATGVAAIPASGGSGSLHYSLDNISFQEDSIFNDLTAGNYTVYIKGDDADYLEERTFTIGEPDLLTLAISEIVEPTCPDSENGSITLSGVGGTGTYLFSLDGEIFEESATFDVLGAGIYTFHLQDENGCTTQIGYTLNSQDQDGEPLLEANGEESTLGVSNEYVSYQWYRNETPLDGQTDTSLYVDNYGAYYVVVEKSAGCMYYSDTLEIPEIVIAEISTLGTSCESNHGVVRVRVTSNFQSFEYAIDDRLFQNSSIFYGLSAGLHTVKIRSELYGYFEEIQVEIGYEEQTESYFESFTDFPLLRLGNPDQNIGWVMSNGGGYDDDFHLYINFYNYNNVGQEDYFIFSNTISTSQRMLLSFAYAYTKYADDLSLNDSLAVLQAIDCSVWQTLDQFGGDEMMTASPINQQFSPVEKGDWAVRSIRIEPSDKEYLLAFKAINGYANSLSIDSITLTTYPNSSPVLELISAEIEENSQSGTLVGQIAASDEDGDAVTYQILSGNTGEVFSLDSISGELTVNNPEVLDYEVLQQIELVVMAYDNYGGSDTTNLIVEILDVDDNEAPVIENQTFTIAENSANGTVVGQVIASDPEGDALTFIISYGNIAKAFEIGESTGELSVANSNVLDFENIPNFNIGIEVMDAVGKIKMANLVISLDDVMDGTATGSCRLSRLVDDESIREFYYLGDQLVYSIFDDDFERIETSFEYLEKLKGGITYILENDGTIRTSKFEILYEGDRIAQILKGGSCTFCSNGITRSFKTTFIYENDLIVEIVTDYSDNGVNYSFYDASKFTWEGNVISSEAIYIAPNKQTPYFTSQYKYDDKANPFYGDFAMFLSDGYYDASRWLMPFNVISALYDDGTGSTYSYTYAENGYPLSAFVTVMGPGYDYEVFTGYTYQNCNLKNYPPSMGAQEFRLTENSRVGTVVGKIAASDPNNDVLMYRLVAGNLENTFIINRSTGELLVNNSSLLDYEANPEFILEVEVSDGEFVTTSFITISLYNIIEPPVIWDQSFSANENAPEGTVVGILEGLAQDADGYLEFDIISGNENDAFRIIDGTLTDSTSQLVVNNSMALDFDINSVFELQIEVEWSGWWGSTGKKDTAIVTVYVNPAANHIPKFSSQSFSIDENSLTGSFLGTIVATDEDADALTFKILYGNTNNAFALEASTGKLTVLTQSVLDFEVRPKFELLVEVNDGKGGVASAKVTISLNNVEDSTNTAPTISDQTFSVKENEIVGTVVGTVQATDADGDALMFSIVSGNTGNAFALEASTGKLSVLTQSALDFETKPVFSLEVEVSDGKGGAARAIITINLLDEDESNNTPPTISTQTFSVKENEVVGTVVGTVQATDADGDALTFSIVSGNTGNAFALEASTGKLSVLTQSALDFETKAVFSLEVEVSDGKGGVAKAIITINLLDVDETTNSNPLIAAQTFSIDENRISGTVVGDIAASDPDGDKLTFSITSGNTNEAFVLNAESGQLTVNTQSALDFETTPVFTLGIKVDDDKGGSASASITVNLNDVNENGNVPPTLDAVSATLDENTATRKIVVYLEATDEDDSQLDLQYSIIQGNIDEAFAIGPFGFGANIVTWNSEALDFEKNPVFNLIVKVDDGRGGSATANATITLLNVEEPPVLNDMTYSVDENSNSGTLVGVLKAEDPEGDPITYKILDGNLQSAFSLNASTGELIVNASSALDFETMPEFNLQVEVNDGNGGAALATITVNLTNIDETRLIPATFEIAENSPAGTVIGSVGYFEPGTQDVPYFKTDQIDQNDPDLIRGIDMINSGALVFSADNFDLLVDFPDPFDFEAVSTFKIQVALCCYPFGEEPTATYTINLIDVNEAPSLEEVIFNLDENSPEGSLVGTLEGLDPDGDELTYSIVSGNANNAFSLISNTGELKVQTSSALDFETMPEFNLEVEVMDGNGSNALATITIQLNDLEEEVLKLKDLAGDLVVFPNPFSETITIRIPQDKLGSALVLSDLSGREIYRTTINSIELTIPMSSLTSGTYLLSIGGQFKKIYKSK